MSTIINPNSTPTLIISTDDVLEHINNLGRKDYGKIAHIYGEEGAKDIVEALIAEGIVTVESIVDMPFAASLIEWAEGQILATHYNNLNVKASKSLARLRHRVKWQWRATFKLYRTKRGSDRLRHDPELRPGGLIERYLGFKGYNKPQPVSIQMLNTLPEEEDENGRKVQPGYPMEMWDSITESFVVSGERIAWCDEAAQLLGTLFPTDIDFRSYNHSLNTAVYADMHDVEVYFATVKTLFGLDKRTDGSGIIHPDHPLFEVLGRPGGHCAIQVRYFTPEGVFAKGMLVPDETALIDGKPAIIFDWAQVKGSKKAQAKKLRAEARRGLSKGSIGVIRVFDRPSTINGGFEMLQLIELNDTTMAIIEKWVDAAIKKLSKRGALTQWIAEDDKNLQLMVHLFELLKKVEPDANPLAIQTLREKARIKLMKVLFRIAQGAGKKFKQVVVILDAALARGTVVCDGYKAGEKLATMRFPIILPQGLQTYEVVSALPHHKVRGKQNREVIYMNPDDALQYHQADDDGDTFGVTNDPDALTLFANRIGDDKTYMIEPEGIKRENPWNSPEGLKYIQGNPMGPVGLMTILQAKLYAVGDFMGAVAIAIMIQEAIDCAKRVVLWSDWRKAANIDNWEQSEDGCYRFEHKLPKDMYDGDDMPVKEIMKWVNERLRRKGVILTDNVKQDPLGWRTEVSWTNEAGEVEVMKKRIDPETWQECVVNAQGWRGSNLVHHCHDYALAKWMEIRDEVMGELNNVKEVKLSTVLGKLLIAHGYHVTYPAWTWETYQNGLRERSGVADMVKGIKDAMAFSSDSQKKYEKIEEALSIFHEKLRTECSLQDQLNIWCLELDHKEGNVNNAFRAISFEGSKILTALGIESSKGCDFLTFERVNKIVDMAVKDSDPFEFLVKAIFNSHSHAKEIRDENGHGIPGYECEHCTKRLTDALVRRIRSDKQSTEYQWLNDTITSLNKHSRLVKTGDTEPTNPGLEVVDEVVDV